MYFQGKKPKFWPDKLHWILGYVVISFALFNSFLGFANYFVSVFTYVVYGIYIIVILSFFIFLQVRVGQLHEYANMEEPRPNKTRADVTLLVVFFVVISVILFATLLSAFV
jgi:Ca2+/Na+ antiporter